jgi:hypothetical protein
MDKNKRVILSEAKNPEGDRNAELAIRSGWHAFFRVT